MIRLLLIDDEIASLTIARKFIQSFHMDIEIIGEAYDGIEAMRYIESADPPQLVITDMNMPMMDGVSVLKFLQDTHPEILTIVISGYFDFSYTQAAVRNGAQDYLLKPIDPVELKKSLTKCCELINRQKMVALEQPENRLKVDVALYREVLHCSDTLNDNIEFGGIKGVDAALKELEAVLNKGSYAENVVCWTGNMIRDSLIRYCVAREYGIPEDLAGRESPADIPGMITFVRSMYEERINQKQESRIQAGTANCLPDVYQYIQEHYREEIRLDAIADLFHFNKEYLATLFKKKYGDTIGELITKLKMEDAKRQLVYSDNTLDQIAASLGYDDPSYFQRQFKKIEGMPPGKYRKINKK